MAAQSISLLNQSKRVTEHEALLMALAVGRQLAWQVSPVWRRDMPVIELVTEVTATTGEVVLLLDAPDADGALGYHEELGDRVVAKVFANPVLDNGGTVLGDPADLAGYSVSATLSHELIELALDPDVNLYADGPDGRSYAVEGCDAVEDGSYIVSVHGHKVAVSDFLYPAWFDPEAPPDMAFSFLGAVKAPFTLTPGGYTIVRDGGPGSEQQVFGEKMPAWRQAAKKAPGGRAARRGAPRAAASP